MTLLRSDWLVMLILDWSECKVLVIHVGTNVNKKMPKNDTLDALEEQEEHDDDYQTITN